jgi:sulfur carrier protein
MRIQLNGENKETQARTIAELLSELNAPETGTAVALNGAVVRRAEHENTPLREDDDVEVIRAVQGG